MTNTDSEDLIEKVKKEINSATHPAEASQWAKCLRDLVTAVAIQRNIADKLHS